MEQENDSWHLQKFYCPNCRNLLVGVADNKGVVRVTCKRCGLVMVHRQMGRRHDRMDIYSLKGAERITTE